MQLGRRPSRLAQRRDAPQSAHLRVTVMDARPQKKAGFAPYSQCQVEKSFSYCGTSFQTPFSFLLVMVMSCGW